ncbi:MAG TPA: 16S rRNA (uracil(1498)-N(3))-methyltransferase [Pyrinomonadaceae bacterium]|nr:16S rRNA (uracil(1498)-N(3))-methyltransferase [Pyrinomonadaceae bacterium]
MTRRRFYAPRIAFAADNNTVKLGADEARHAHDVLRLGVGDEGYVFDGEGHEYRCVIAEVSSRSATLTVVERVQAASPESPLELTLAVALLKGEKFDLVAQKAAELGVTRLAPLVTARADVRIREPGEARKKAERWSRIAFESAKQCGRAQLMLVDPPTNLDEFFRSITDVQLKLTYTARDGDPHADLFKMEVKSARVVAMIGSEGGWTDGELLQARANGCRIVTLGGRTLRAETAAIAVATLLQHRFGDLK